MEKFCTILWPKGPLILFYCKLKIFLILNFKTDIIYLSMLKSFGRLYWLTLNSCQIRQFVAFGSRCAWSLVTNYFKVIFHTCKQSLSSLFTQFWQLWKCVKQQKMDIKQMIKWASFKKIKLLTSARLHN